MKSARLVLLTLLLAASAHADVAGTWSGTGEWTSGGSGTDCPSMTIRFSESSTALKRISGYFDCGIVALHSDPQEWTKQGDRLIFDGQEAGSWTDHSFTAREPYGDGVTIETKLTIKNDVGDYLEIWRDEKNRAIYVIKGEFTRRR